MPEQRREQRAAPEAEIGRPTAQAQETLPEVPGISVYGDFIDRLAVIPHTLMTLLIGTGRLVDEGKSPVLIPYVEMKLAGPAAEDQPSPRTLFGEILTLENGAFVIADLASDFRLACEYLQSLSAGELRPEPARIEHARHYILHAQTQIEGCLSALNDAVARLRTT